MQAASVSGVVSSVALAAGGSGYTSYPTCTLTGGGGSGAGCFAYICVNEQVCYVALTNFGGGYTSAPACKISGGGGSGATCTAYESKGVAALLTAVGSGYTTMPHCVLSGGGGTGATCGAAATNSSGGYQPAFNATTGWDFATGIGTVNVANLVASFIQGPVVLYPFGLAFSSQNIGTTSAPQSVTLTNEENTALSISSVNVGGTNAGDFSKSADSCSGVTVAPNGTCSVSVTFTPSAGGSRSASLNFTDSAANSPQSVSLSGTGSGLTVTLLPAALTFTSQDVGTTSKAQSVLLTNTGKLSLVISSISLSGTNASAFADTTTCGGTLSMGATCTISVTFTPAAAGTAAATLSVTDDATGSPQTVNLSGAGVAVPTVSLSASSLVFGTQEVGTSSVAQAVTLSNTGTASLIVSSVALTGTNPGTFVESNTCGTVSVGGSCSISVTFAPPSSGSKSASVTITDNAPNSPQSITLSGTAVQPTISLSPTSLSFGSQALGGSSTAKTVTLTNTSTLAVILTSIAIGGANASAFSQSNTCGATLSAGANCTVSVTFAPQKSGSMSASLAVADNATGSPQSVSLTGTGTGPVVSLSPASLTFAKQALNTTSNAQVITLTNTGNASLSISSIALTGSSPGAFDATTTCGSSLSAGANCAVSVTFSPTVTGSSTAGLAITDNALLSPQSVNLSGTGVATPSVSLSPSSLSFATQAVGTSSSTQAVTLTNTGSAALNLTSLAITGTSASAFSQSNTCGATLSAGASCTVSVSFSPQQTGSMGASLMVANNAANSPQSVSLTGLGAGPVVHLNPTSLTFANQGLNTTSNSQAVALTNMGNETLSISSIGLTGSSPGAFGETTTCGSSVSAGANCLIFVTFSPTAAGSSTATVTITDNATSSPQSVNLSGTGVAAASLSLSPSSLSFATQPVGTSSSAQAVTLTNTGSATLNITSLATTGTNASAFSQSNTCGATLSAGASCAVSVTFSPQKPGSMSASLTVADNAPNSPQSVSLTGMGAGPVVSLSPASLTFANQILNTTSDAQMVTLINTGNETLSISSIALTGSSPGAFGETTTCGSSLSAGANCLVFVTFSPTAAGSSTAALTITDNAASSSQSVNLSGTGVAAAGGS